MECPDENELLRFSLGESTEDRRDALDVHLDACASCRTALAAIAVASAAPLARAEASQLEVGTVLGRYRVERVVGRGAMGTVYAAKDLELERPVALKVLHTEAFEAAAPDAKARILHEARAMARLSHPNVVGVYEVGETPVGVPFIAMELVEGETLDAWGSAARRTAVEILSVFRQAGAGLQAAHAGGLVHGDFKPQNVLVGADGRVRVTDFGLARHGPAQDGPLSGTPAYMAPEQLSGTADARSDQFAFCVSLYEALAGRRPFEGKTLEALGQSISRGLPATGPKGMPLAVYAALKKGLAADPTKRFAELRALLVALDGSARRRTPALIAVALVLVLLAGLGVWSALNPHARERTANMDEIVLPEGEQTVLDLPGLRRLTVADPEIADVQTPGSDQVVLAAHHPGSTTLFAWTQDGTRYRYPVRVIPSRAHQTPAR